MAGRKPLFVLLSLLMATMVGAAETPASSPPADTPVIPWTRFNIQYAVRIVGNNNLSKVVFYITSDGGKTWKFYAEDADKQSPMVVQVPGEGVYGFATVVGTQYRPAKAPRAGTRPDRFVIVDRTPPKARWLSPLKGDLQLGADGKIKLAWEATDEHLGIDPVSIEYSTDGGRYWLPLRDKLAAKGEFGWAPPLMEGENEIMLRLIARDLAGNRRIVRNRAQFSMDRQPPVVKIIGPASSGKYEFDVIYTAQDESGVSQADLYYTLDNGNEWFYFGPDKDGVSPLRFTSPAAREVGLYIVAVDPRGNRNVAPKNGQTRPMAVVKLDMQAPEVTMLPPFASAQTVIALNQPQRVSWSAADVNISANSAVLQYSTDGGANWITVKEGLPANGVYAWTPPVAGDNILLKVSVSDSMGNVGTASSMPFRVDANPPSTTIEDVRPLPTNGGTGTSATDPWKPTLGDGAGADVSIPGMTDGAGNPLTSEVPSAVRTDPVAPVSAPPASAGTAAGVSDIAPPAGDAGMSSDVPTIAPPAGIAAVEAPGDSSIPNVPTVAPGAAGNPVAPVETPDVSSLPPAGVGIPNIPGTDATAPVETAAPLDVPDVPPAGGAATTTESGVGSIPEIPTIGGGADGVPAIGMTGGTPSSATSDAGTTLTADKLLEQAEQAYSARQYDQAESLSRKALKKDPNSARAYALLSSVYTEKGKYQDAIDSAQRAIHLTPGQTRYRQILGYAYYAKAQDITRQLDPKAMAQPQQQKFIREAARALDLAEENYRQMLGTADQADLKEAYYRIGQIDYLRATRMTNDNAAIETSLRRAIDNYEKAFKVGTPEYREVLQIGICNYRLKNYDQAERWLERAQEVAPQDRPAKEAFFYLAMIYEKMEKPELALPFWEKVGKLYEQGSRYQQLGERRSAALRRQLNQ